MPTFFRSLFWLLLLTISSAHAFASILLWDQTEARIEMKPEQTEAKASFTVTNQGEETLRISDVRASCGCTGSVIDRRILEPGESTSIQATFNKGKRKGRNHTKLEVFLSSQPKAVATLHMIVEIPELVSTQPRIIYWNSKTSEGARTVRVQLDERYVSDQNVRIEYDESLFNVTREADPSGKANFLLKVEPKDFELKTRDTIEIIAKGLNKGPEAIGKIHAFVQK